MTDPTLPVGLVAHTDAKAADVLADLQHLVGVLTQNVDGLNLETGAPGQLWVADGSGVFQLRTVSGDGGFNGAGAFAIGDGKVRSRHFKPTAGVVNGPSINQILPGGLSDVTSMSLAITPLVSSTLVVTAEANIEAVGANVAVRIKFSTDAVDGNVNFADFAAKDVGDIGMAIVSREIPLDVNPHTIKMRADSTGGAATIRNARMRYFLVAA